MKRTLCICCLLFSLMSVRVSAAGDHTVTLNGMLERICGAGASDKFELVVDGSLAENGKDVFIISSSGGRPCIKGNSVLSVATGINWYLNHTARINLTWNRLNTDLSGTYLPLPQKEEKHVCSADYRYYLNYCTFSYSMAFWSWGRWEKRARLDGFARYKHAVDVGGYGRSVEKHPHGAGVFGIGDSRFCSRPGLSGLVADE